MNPFGRSASNTSSPTFSLKETSFCIVLNIPPQYKSKHLRNFFHYLVERKAFICFHYRHRLQGLQVKSNELNAEEQPDKSVNIHKPSIGKQCKKYCALVAVKQTWLSTFINRFNNQLWTWEDGNDLPSKCFIRLIKIDNEITSNEDWNGTQIFKADTSLLSKATSLLNRSQLKTYSKNRLNSANNDSISKSNLENIKLSKLKTFYEFNPPALMPQGNVGTPTDFFLSQISACRLPPTIVKKLDLRFPRGVIKRAYSAVEYQYTDIKHSNKAKIIDDEDNELIRAQNGQIISDNFAQLPPEIKRTKIENYNEEDDSEEEEWDRHEALVDDPTEQERLEEPLFEEEIEIKWEKGGSGLVFYTDAQFWNLLETSGNDFDAISADHMNIELDEEFFDKDMKDLHSICQRKPEHEPGSALHNCIQSQTGESNRNLENWKCLPKRAKKRTNAQNQFGKFEFHSKGIGRKILEKYGWSQGEGLGKDKEGIAEPLANDGQNPNDKRGFGYFGEKLQAQQQ